MIVPSAGAPAMTVISAAAAPALTMMCPGAKAVRRGGSAVDKLTTVGSLDVQMRPDTGWPLELKAQQSPRFADRESSNVRQ